jgi:phosphoglycolate phosphatase
VNEWPPTAVIFDLDGTLIDSLPGIEYSAKAAFAACGMLYPDVDLRSLIGPPIRTILSQVAKTSAPDVLIALENAFRASYDSDGWKESYVYPGTEAILSAMHDSGIRLFVLTNKPAQISNRILEIRGIRHLFEWVVTRDSRTPPYADKREMLGVILGSCALKTFDYLFIGDTEEDAMAAAAHDIRFGYVSHGYGTISDENAVPVHIRLPNFHQLAQAIGVEFAHDR